MVDKIKIWGGEYKPLHKARGIDYAVTSSHQPGRPGDYTSYVIIGKTRDEDYIIEKYLGVKSPLVAQKNGQSKSHTRM